MVEYAVVASKGFGDTFLNNWQDVTHYLSAIPYYWYIIAAVALLLFIKALSGKKI
jgi:hypothetical protein